MKVGMLPECFLGMETMSGWGTPPLPSIVKPKPIDEVLVEATVRNVRVDEIKVKVCRRIGIFKQVLCEVVASFFFSFFT